MRGRRFIAWYVGGTAALLSVWLATAVWFIPSLIQSAYRGEAIGLLNQIIRGRSQHPVERYLDLWSALVVPITLGLLALAVAGLLVYRFRVRLRGWARAALWRDPTVSLGRAAGLGIWFGLGLGIFQAVPPLARQALGGYTQDLLGQEVLWMAPLSGATLGLVTASVGWLLLRIGGSPSLRPFVLVLGAFATYTFIRGSVTGLHAAAAAVLALGAAARLTTFCAGRAPGLQRLVRRTVVWGTVCVVALAGGMFAEERYSEARAVAGLPDALRGAPNIIFIILDTVRAKSLSLYGYDRATTPGLDAFARSGAVFDRALVTAPWTLPSHATMFTGRWHHEISADWETRLDDQWPTLAEEMADHGYRTGAFVGNLWFCARGTGLERGFARYSDHRVTPIAILRSTWVGRGLYRNFLALTKRHPRTTQQRRAPSVSAEFLGWIDADSNRPFFAFLNYADAHHPYHMPPPFDLVFADPAPRWWMARWGTGYPPEELSELQDAYDSSIAYLDSELDRLFSELERRGQLDNTLVIVTSDHGEQFGEHDLAMHGNSLYLPLLRVPLLMRLPGRIPSDQRVESVVSIRDLPSTILEVVGLDRTLPGNPLTRFWDGSDSSAGSWETVFSHVSESDFALETDPVSKGAMNSAVLGGLNLIRNGDGSEELYDLRTDLPQLHNLIGSEAHAKQLAELRKVLLESESMGSGR